MMPTYRLEVRELRVTIISGFVGWETSDLFGKCWEPQKVATKTNQGLNMLLQLNLQMSFFVATSFMCLYDVFFSPRSETHFKECKEQ